MVLANPTHVILTFYSLKDQSIFNSLKDQIVD